MTRKRDQTYLDGEITSYLDLQEKFNISSTTVARFIKKHGRLLSSSMFTKNRATRKRYQLYLDGELTCCLELQKRFKIPASTVEKLVNDHGRWLLTSMFAKKKAKKDAQVVVKHIHWEDRSPGWLERREFPQAGANGFSKFPVDSFSGYDSKGNAVYTGSRS